MNPSAFVKIGSTSALLLLITVGCGESGPPRYHVSGTVTYQGEPVPLGSIVFQPDPSKDNSGPYGTANIKDGKYDTRSGGEPISGGPQIVFIEAYDGKSGDSDLTPYGQSLAPGYQKSHDLPLADSTLDIELTED